VNDVLLGVTQAALTLYLNRAYGKVLYFLQFNFIKTCIINECCKLSAPDKWHMNKLFSELDPQQIRKQISMVPKGDQVPLRTFALGHQFLLTLDLLVEYRWVWLWNN